MRIQKTVWSLSDSLASRSPPQGFLFSSLKAKEVVIIVPPAFRNTAKSKEALVCVFIVYGNQRNDGFSEGLSI